MSKIRDEEKNAMDLGRKVEAQPLHALPMPPYGALSITNTDLSLRAENERLRADAYKDELLKIAADVGEPDDPFAAWEAIAALKAKLEEAAKVLEKIERWHGEFPETGQFWTNADGTDSDRAMSYGAAYGSNGERDYMRSQARSFLANLKGAE